MTDPQADILLHTLGLSRKDRDGYRNHYVAGDGHHAMDAISALVADGLMVEARRPDFLPDGDRVFMATERGIAIARVTNRRINPDPPRSKSRYLRWLTLSDVCPDLTFGEYLRRRMYADPMYGGSDAE